MSEIINQILVLVNTIPNYVWVSITGLIVIMIIIGIVAIIGLVKLIGNMKKKFL